MNKYLEKVAELLEGFEKEAANFKTIAKRLQGRNKTSKGFEKDWKGISSKMQGQKEKALVDLGKTPPGNSGKRQIDKFNKIGANKEELDEEVSKRLKRK